MKTLVVGDLHLKQPFVLPALDVLLAGDPDIARVVFLGDACDDWGATEADELGALEFYAQWVDQRRRRGLAVDVLAGNHDFCYIRGRRGSGSVMTIARELRALLEDELRVQMACVVGPYLCSHAGLTSSWTQRHMPGVPRDAASLAARLNEMLAEPECWAALDSCPPSRGGTQLPGPLWANLTDMLDDALPEIPQVVGHTPVPDVEDYAPFSRAGRALWACDTLSLSRAEVPLGAGSLLLVDERGEARAVPFPGELSYAEAYDEYQAARW